MMIECHRFAAQYLPYEVKVVACRPLFLLLARASLRFRNVLVAIAQSLFKVLTIRLSICMNCMPTTVFEAKSPI